MKNKLIDGLCTHLHRLTGHAIYTEHGKNNIDFPCFFVRLIEDKITQDLGDRYIVDSQFDIQYFHNESDEIDDVYRIHEIGDALYFELEYVRLDENTIVRGEDMHYRITDGVLHFFVTYEVHILKKRDKLPTMQRLELKEALKDG